MSQEEYILHLEQTIKSLENQVSNLTEMVLMLNKKQFGHSSEKTPKAEVIDEQLCLESFDEVENLADSKVIEPPLVDMVATRKKTTRARREQLIQQLPVTEVECVLEGDDKLCPWCNSPLEILGKEQVRQELQFIPAQLKITNYVRYTYICPSCKQDGESTIIKAPTPPPVIKHSLASASSVAHVMYQKYYNALPLYRQEKDWLNYGIKINRTTLANWVIIGAEDWLTPLVARLKDELLKHEVLHADETVLQVLHEPDKKPTTQSYMWLFRTGLNDQKPVVLFNYAPTRGGYHAEKYLKGFKGYLHTDGYQGYEKVQDIIHCGCWSHLRRYFVEAIPPGENNTGEKSLGEIGRDFCNQLFSIEQKLADLEPEERKSRRLELEKPVLEAFWCWIHKLNPLKGSRLGKAVTYAKNQQKYMENYLLDGRCSLSNNLAENSIRPFTVGRKNWEFANSVKGAHASSTVYSIIETAKANNLNVFKYLRYLLQELPKMDFKNNPKLLDELLPWQAEVQKICH